MAFKMKKFSGFGEGSGKKAPMNFNAGLRAASKAGKLDNNPKFKAAVDNAPMKKDNITDNRKKKVAPNPKPYETVQAKKIEKKPVDKNKVYLKPSLIKNIKSNKKKENFKNRIKKGIKNVANMPIKDFASRAATGTLGAEIVKRFTKK